MNTVRSFSQKRKDITSSSIVTFENNKDFTTYTQLLSGFKSNPKKFLDLTGEIFVALSRKPNLGNRAFK